MFRASILHGGVEALQRLKVFHLGMLDAVFIATSGTSKLKYKGREHSSLLQEDTLTAEAPDTPKYFSPIILILTEHQFFFYEPPFHSVKL